MNTVLRLSWYLLGHKATQKLRRNCLLLRNSYRKCETHQSNDILIPIFLYFSFNSFSFFTFMIYLPLSSHPGAIIRQAAMLDLGTFLLSPISLCYENPRWRTQYATKSDQSGYTQKRVYALRHESIVQEVRSKH